ncbi:acylneuraminate cytidylyltransferase family protein [Pseudomonas sp. PS01298]|uniref:acylneuraminate cytidylyltransferase family protein n=1 Tax=Pseudomonas sp. PS01298 TaxID=2991434 RepID=UPI000EA2C4F2|nr:acylneuraminate cytidylyltransferase family protein [Pseudomonas sp. PS01298]AYF47614.1 acylneuraminate cytidylyltransferase family protein [Pseudomonas fluorescens]QTV18314.1 acylneuraminate cytidylyltransferase family protein [Pseudomonas fluorescens]
MNILAIVPARGGSKRLPGKNIKLLGDRPLIAWTIDAAKLSGEFMDILVTTDDVKIANAAERCGGVILHRRSAELSSDTASSYDVVMDALDKYESVSRVRVQGVMLLQPTSPFRTAESIGAAVRLFSSSKAPVVSVCRSEVHPAWTFKINGVSLDPFLGWDDLILRSQELPAAYTLTGSIYLITPEDLRRHKRFLIPGTQPLVTSHGAEALDIDTADDWQEALRHLAYLHP